MSEPLAVVLADSFVRPSPPSLQVWILPDEDGGVLSFTSGACRPDRSDEEVTVKRIP